MCARPWEVTGHITIVDSTRSVALPPSPSGQLWPAAVSFAAADGQIFYVAMIKSVRLGSSMGALMTLLGSLSTS